MQHAIPCHYMQLCNYHNKTFNLGNSVLNIRLYICQSLSDLFAIVVQMYKDIIYDHTLCFVLIKYPLIDEFFITLPT